MDKHTALESLVNITNKNLGTTPSSPSEFSEVILKIQKKTGRAISLSSVKRIWGYVTYESFPSITTLNTLAQFNGFTSWDTFLLSHNGTDFDDSGFIEESVITADKLEAGDRVLLQWGKDKSCEIEYLSHFRFRINQSKNIKLLAGDTCRINILCLKHPIFISDIEHGGMHIPAYIGARKGGISSITLIKTKR